MAITPGGALNSQQRNWYLGVLGVVRYVSRENADGVGEEPARAQASIAVEETRLVRDNETGRSKSATDSTSATEVKQSVPRRVSNAQPTAAVAKTTSKGVTSTGIGKTNINQAVQFRLAFWQPSDQLTVLTSMPPRLRPSQGQQEMLANLLRAINQLSAELPQMELLDWPLSPGGDSSLQGAQELLSAFLEVKNKLRSFKYTLLMGEIAANLTRPGGSFTVGEKVPLSCNAQGIVTHSLYDMERDKSLKKATWEAIRFLSGGGN